MTKLFKYDVADVEIYENGKLKAVLDSATKVRIVNGKIYARNILIPSDFPFSENKQGISIVIKTPLLDVDTNVNTHDLHISYYGVNFAGISEVNFEAGDNEGFTFVFNVEESSVVNKIVTK